MIIAIENEIINAIHVNIAILSIGKIWLQNILITKMLQNICNIYRKSLLLQYNFLQYLLISCFIIISTDTNKHLRFKAFNTNKSIASPTASF